jgi:hypothetical protein
MALPSPKEVAEDLIRRAPDEAWLRELTDELDREVRTEPLDRFMELWGLSGAEAARAFGVSRQAFAKWRDGRLPADRAGAVADVAAATDLLDRKVKRERIPAVVRRRAEGLGGRSLYDLACADGHAAVLEAVRAMFDLRRAQP